MKSLFSSFSIALFGLKTRWMNTAYDDDSEERTSFKNRLAILDIWQTSSSSFAICCYWKTRRLTQWEQSIYARSFPTSIIFSYYSYTVVRTDIIRDLLRIITNDYCHRGLAIYRLICYYFHEVVRSVLDAAEVNRRMSRAPLMWLTSIWSSSAVPLPTSTISRYSLP